MPPFLILDRLDKSFGGRRVLRDVSVEVEEGEILVLLGESGSGKTTLLRLVAGFEHPDRGAIRVAGEEVTPLPPARRNFGMVFQHYALFPHLSVGENVAFGLESRRADRTEVRGRVAEMLALVDLEGFEARRVHQISGGQQQRVALARALAPHPRVLLLDEPLSNLDPTLRERTRRQLRGAVRRVGITALWVTHEQEEAFEAGDRVALLNRGRLEQVGSPEELYLEPRSRFVAGFVGRASALPGIAAAADRVLLGGRPGGAEEPAAGTTPVEWECASLEPPAPGEAVEVVLRPEGLDLVAEGTRGALVGTVAERRYRGESTDVSVELDAGGSVLVAAAAGAARPGDRVAVAPRPDAPPPRVFRAAARAPGEGEVTR